MSRSALLLTAAVGLCSSALVQAVPAPKGQKPVEPASFGIELQAANFVRKGDAVDVHLLEPNTNGACLPILSRLSVIAVESDFVRLAVSDREREILLSASKRGQISLSPHDPLFDAERLMPKAGETHIPILLGD